jgi:hypothetical protein
VAIFVTSENICKIWIFPDPTQNIKKAFCVEFLGSKGRQGVLCGLLKEQDI